MTVLTDKPEVGQTDVALLAEELVEIYSTPIPMGWPEPKKVRNLYLIDCVLYNSRGPIFIPGTMLLKHDSSQFWTKRKHF